MKVYFIKKQIFRHVSASVHDRTTLVMEEDVDEHAEYVGRAPTQPTTRQSYRFRINPGER